MIERGTHLDSPSSQVSRQSRSSLARKLAVEDEHIFPHSELVFLVGFVASRGEWLQSTREKLLEKGFFLPESEVLGALDVAAFELVNVAGVDDSVGCDAAGKFSPDQLGHGVGVYGVEVLMFLQGQCGQGQFLGGVRRQYGARRPVAGVHDGGGVGLGVRAVELGIGVFYDVRRLLLPDFRSRRALIDVF